MINLTRVTKAEKPAKPGSSLSGGSGQHSESTVIHPVKHWRWGREVVFVIEQSGIQMAAVSWYGRSYKLIDARKIYIPTRSDTPVDRETFISQAIAEYTAKFGGPNPKAILSISGPHTVFRTFTMPSMASKQLDAAIRFEARKQIPFPVTDCYYDYRAISRVSREESSRLKISLQAATKTSVQELLQPFEQSKIDVTRVYHSHDVLGQLLKYLPEFAPDQHFTLLNIERGRSELAYYRGSELEFAHVCTLGSSFIADRTDPTVFEYFAESLAGEIQNSLDYYTGQVSSQHANRIYIYGDLAYTEDLISLMTDNFGFTFRRFPVEELELDGYPSESVQSAMTVCLPALAAASCAVRLADLLPDEMKQRQKTRRLDRVSMLGLVLVAAALGVLWLTAMSGRTAAQRTLNGLNAQIEEFKNSRLFDTYNSLKQQIAFNQAYLEKAKAAPSNFGLLLKELSNLTPANIRLNHFNFNPAESEQNIQIQGVVSSASVPPEVILAEFAENLRSSPLFQNVTVVRYSKKTVGNGFDLDFELSSRGVQ